MQLVEFNHLAANTKFCEHVLGHAAIRARGGRKDDDTVLSEKTPDV